MGSNEQIPISFGEENAPIRESATARFSREKDNCTYCQDAGPCRYCKRGRNETAELRKSPRKLF